MAADPLPETPAAALGPTVTETVDVEGRAFLLSRPDAVDRLIDDPVLGAAAAFEEYMPYWANLWPAARVLAAAVLREPWPARASALEIGCGLGLPGLAALARGLQVTFSDFDATALRFAAANVRLNGFTHFHTLQMDVRRPVDGLQVDVLLAADVAYQKELFVPLARLVKRGLAADGLCLLADGERAQAAALRAALTAERLIFSFQPQLLNEPAGPRQIMLYRITHGR